MNIKRVKEEIKNTAAVYLQKDEYGRYRMDRVHQRPILLIGPPGIGKTAIMEQVARECGIGLVSYTITHHTRQSAIGLPFLETRKYGEKEYKVTEYTMSEIIGSVYDKMEETGLKEGILFIDEINCVSETLAPTMLQFLQGKTFGQHQVPEGWIIVAAGNPPEYNKSVREFDVVTLDRVKRIQVDQDFDVWKDYAYERSVHGAVLSYLEIKKQNFYLVETTVDGVFFVTARGWEDLSEMIGAYERLGLKPDRELIAQYVQNPSVAADFANYLELYYKYEKRYDVAAILAGRPEGELLEAMGQAGFDERLSVIGMILGGLNEIFHAHAEQYSYLQKLHQCLTQLKEALGNPYLTCRELLEDIRSQKEEERQRKTAGGQLDKEEETAFRKVLETLGEYSRRLVGEGEQPGAFEEIKQWFAQERAGLEQLRVQAAEQLEHSFSFMEQAFGKSPEMVIFLTELSRNYYSMHFISQYGSDTFYRYNKELLFRDRERELKEEIAELERLQAE